MVILSAVVFMSVCSSVNGVRGDLCAGYRVAKQFSHVQAS